MACRFDLIDYRQQVNWTNLFVIEKKTSEFADVNLNNQILNEGKMNLRNL